MARDILTLQAPPADYRIPWGPGEFQFGDLRLPPGPGPHPAVIIIHGGYWRSAFDLLYAGHMAAALTRRGVATWNIEYRRIGNPGGGYPGTLDDVAGASIHLSKIATVHPLNMGRVVAMGHSAGGQLALWLATSKQGVPLRGAVSLAGVLDLKRAFDLKLSNTVVADLLGGSPQQYPDRYKAASPIERLPSGVPTRLIHGEADDVVPMEFAENYEKLAKAKGDDCRLIKVPGDHFDVVDPRSQVWKTVSDIVLEL